MANLTGVTIGDYRLTRFLGAGGMGEVYEAQQQALGRTVAVKVLSPGQSELSDRFVNEARVHARLQHPNVVTLYDFLDFEGRLCIVMELVHGETIEDRIRRVGALPVSEAVFVMQALVEAVGHVHSKGIIHRDIKSGNVKITPEGDVKLLDFGIARARELPRMTAVGQFVGTLQYSSPEQLRGDDVDARCDVWALGVLLYEMVTGQMPFEAVSVGDLLEKVQKSSYPPAAVLNPRVPREVEQVIGRCLARRTDSRYPNAESLLIDVVALSKVVSAPRISQVAGSPRQAVRSWRLPALPSLPPLPSSVSPWWIGAAAVILLALLWVTVSDRPEPTTLGDLDPARAPADASELLAPVVVDSPTGKTEVWIGGVRVGQVETIEPMGA